MPGPLARYCPKFQYDGSFARALQFFETDRRMDTILWMLCSPHLHSKPAIFSAAADTIRICMQQWWPLMVESCFCWSIYTEKQISAYFYLIKTPSLANHQQSKLPEVYLNQISSFFDWLILFSFEYGSIKMETRITDLSPGFKVTFFFLAEANFSHIGVNNPCKKSLEKRMRHFSLGSNQPYARKQTARTQKASLMLCVCYQLTAVDAAPLTPSDLSIIIKSLLVTKIMLFSKL